MNNTLTKKIFFTLVASAILMSTSAYAKPGAHSDLESRKMGNGWGHPTAKYGDHSTTKSRNAHNEDFNNPPPAKEHPVHDGKKSLYYKIGTKGVNNESLGGLGGSLLQSVKKPQRK